MRACLVLAGNSVSYLLYKELAPTETCHDCSLHDAKREDFVFLAFQIWLFGISIVTVSKGHDELHC